MTDFWALLFNVVDGVAVLYAVASGLAIGSTFLLWLSLRFPMKILLPTLHLAVLAAAATAFVGTVFFAGQIVQALATDPNWPRALGRAFLWEIFSLSIGVGLGVARSFAHREQHA